MSKTPITDALKSILSSEEKWTKGAFAVDKQNEIVDMHSNEACCYCITGAILVVSDKLKVPASKIYNLFEPIVHGRAGELVNFNDSCITTFEDIQNLLDKAALIEAGETQ